MDAKSAEGLTADVARERLARVGANEIRREQPTSPGRSSWRNSRARSSAYWPWLA